MGFVSHGLVILFAVKLMSVATVSYTVAGARRNLLLGLEPGRQYDVLVDGSRVKTLQATVNGTLDFENSAAAKIDVVRK
jgi:hypothetical protein